MKSVTTHPKLIGIDISCKGLFPVNQRDTYTCRCHEQHFAVVLMATIIMYLFQFTQYSVAGDRLRQTEGQKKTTETQ